MPPSGKKYKKFRWTFGCPDKRGYLQIRFRGKQYRVHRVICETFHGLAPEDSPTVDHINRNKRDNRPENLRWASYKLQIANTIRVIRSVEKYGVLRCDDRANPEYAKREREYLARQRALGKKRRRCPDGKRHWLTDSEFSAMFG